MVKIGDLLDDELIVDHIKATDKPGVIREFSEALQRAGKVPDADELTRVLLEREALGSTGIGDGVAIPHGKLRGLREMVVAFGRSAEGVDFQSLDGKPVYLFFLLITPDDNPGIHLKTLARISRILKNPAFRAGLRRAPGVREIRRLICEEDCNYPKNES